MKSNLLAPTSLPHRMHVRLLGLVVLTQFGCAAIPGPWAHGIEYSNKDAASFGSGQAFCHSVATRSRKTAQRELAGGILMGFAAAGALAAGAVVGAKDTPTSAERGVVIAMPTLAAAMSVGSGLFITRSKQASELAGAASRGVVDKSVKSPNASADSAAACRAALASWEDGRSAAAGVAEQQLEDARKELAENEEPENEEPENEEPENEEPENEEPEKPKDR